ncbi:MAG: type II toxin-antitoxin system VapC family toxin [Desulfobacterales bacterium]|nr:type II toxin-antitoxin system VapC family toxin [Desulfobacterales bacterium]
MKLAEIKAGSEIFIDSNIFIYHFTGVSDECSNFLGRCERGELIAMTSVNVILEVLHRLMMVEAVRKNLVKPPNIIKKLRARAKITGTFPPILASHLQVISVRRCNLHNYPVRT